MSLTPPDPNTIIKRKKKLQKDYLLHLAFNCTPQLVIIATVFTLLYSYLSNNGLSVTTVFVTLISVSFLILTNWITKTIAKSLSGRTLQELNVENHNLKPVKDKPFSKLLSSDSKLVSRYLINVLKQDRDLCQFEYTELVKHISLNAPSKKTSALHHKLD